MAASREVPRGPASLAGEVGRHVHAVTPGLGHVDAMWVCSRGALSRNRFLTRSRGSVNHTFDRYGWGTGENARTSDLAPSMSGPIFGNRAAGRGPPMASFTSKPLRHPSNPAPRETPTSPLRGTRSTRCSNRWRSTTLSETPSGWLMRTGSPCQPISPDCAITGVAVARGRRPILGPLRPAPRGTGDRARRVRGADLPARADSGA